MGYVPIPANCHWIEPDYMLPTKYDPVLFVVDGKTMSGHFDNNGINWWFVESYRGKGYRENATHWMPLPEPPEVCQKS